MIERQLTKEEMDSVLERLVDEKSKAIRLIKLACPQVLFPENDSIDKIVALFIAAQFGKQNG